MFRIDDATAATSLPVPEAAGTEGYWTEGNPATGVPATLERASWFNMIQEELRAVVVAAGLTPSKTTYTQVRDAIKLLYGPGRLLRVSVYTLVSGAQNVAVNGGAPTTTGATTFTPLATTNAVRVKVLGGGGGGGGSQTTTSGQASIAGPGNAGAYGESWYTSGFSGVAITVGAGGTSAAAAAGTNGGTSSFGALISCPGGKGGVIGVTGATPSGAYPQSAVTPSGANLISSAGALGTYGVALAAAAGLASIGGNSPFGAGGVSGSGNATGFGSGGAGSFIPQSTTGVAAGNGSAGFVIVEEYA